MKIVLENGKLLGGEEEEKKDDLKMNLEGKLQYYLEEMKDKYKAFSEAIGAEGH